ncbi:MULTISPECIES: hypothetical protein [unclassified Nonomuraea]|uniref:hypothetical protein n=1 Tax=unclassified Nonomuraea TaxID=2593643 RepID=UPI0033C9F878
MHPASSRADPGGGKVAPPAGVRAWMLDVTSWEGASTPYVDAMVWLVSKMLAAPKHSVIAVPHREVGAQP